MDDINPYILIPIATVAINQIYKFAAHYRKESEAKWSLLFNLNGQPSWVIAAAVGLLFTTLAVNGSRSALVGAYLLLAAMAIEFERRTTKPSVIDTLAATAVGLLTAIVLSFDYWRDDFDWFVSRPPVSESKNYLFVFGAVLVISEILVIWTRRKKMRKLPTSRKLQRAFRLSLTLPATLGFLFALLQNQTRNDLFTDRLYTSVFFLWIPAATIWAAMTVYSTASKHLAEEADHFAREQKRAKHSKSKKKKSRKKRR